MGTDHHTLVALNALIRKPLGYLDGDTALFVLGGSAGEGPIQREGGNGQVVTFLAIHHLGDFGHEGGFARGRELLVRQVRPSFRNRYFYQTAGADIDGFPVLIQNLLPFSGIGLLDCLFHILLRFFEGDDIGQFEEGGLHDGVDVFAHTD